MIKIIKGDPGEFLCGIERRSAETDIEVEQTVSDIIFDVRRRGDEAVNAYTKKFGCSKLKYYRVPDEAMEEALNEANEKFIEALLNSIENITAFHERQKQNGFAVAKDSGTVMGQCVRGLERVGIYVPGGSAAYPSSVLMNAVPAAIAGVGEIIMVTPPGKDGQANKDILVAAKLCGINKIFMCGGAQAIAALAYGTEEIPRVSKITGPGNIYVATAKKLLYGTVDIDMVAGPSEILIIADDSANPTYIAADLMSQAEHDALAGAVLLTDSEKIAEETVKELQKQIENLPRKEIIVRSLENYGGIIVTENIYEAVELANRIAPEHLEVLLRDPARYIGKLYNVGSLFLGPYSPEPLGDYYAGPNHVLPTGGTARFFSPLSVDSFTKKYSYIYYSKEDFLAAANDILLIAEREGLSAHANSIEVRLK
ncbi:MAG: histidinol dehydrogenase [Eubacterium sp.]|jgi:histidinol dehydrogenase|nr:histidinol dehydrogenase [Eubacterium sp.]